MPTARPRFAAVPRCAVFLLTFHHAVLFLTWWRWTRQVAPLLEKYKVDAYLCGHDHTQQHIENAGVQYYVSGTAF
jgi:3',5'-cyclic AMP phosphodiesterase CpdA